LGLEVGDFGEEVASAAEVGWEQGQGEVEGGAVGQGRVELVVKAVKALQVQRNCRKFMVDNSSEGPSH
jgi:hypothetical protein